MKFRITPLKLCAGYLFCCIAVWVADGWGDPGAVGWAFTISSGLLMFAVVILGLDYAIIHFVNKRRFYWLLQLLLFVLLLMLFVRMGLPGGL